MKHIEEVMESAKLNEDEIDEVVLIGGSARIPKIQQLLRELFKGKEPSHGINSDQEIVYGLFLNSLILIDFIV